jgi:hypothetical protein
MTFPSGRDCCSGLNIGKENIEEREKVISFQLFLTGSN